jgi:hypothetical protein
MEGNPGRPGVHAQDDRPQRQGQGQGQRSTADPGPVPDGPAPVHPAGGLIGPSHLLALQRAAGNVAARQAVPTAGHRRTPRPGGASPVQRTAPGGDVPVQRNGPGGDPRQVAPAADLLGFVREEGLNLRAGPDRAAAPLARLTFGQRVHLLDGSQPGWQRVTVLGQTGYLSSPRIHLPPQRLIQQDPGLSLVKVRPGQTFWGLVKESYGIQGNEGTPDQNINHFINAIRAINRPEAFIVRTDVLDDVSNALIPGRDASDTLLKANYDLWIPSFAVAAKMDVGSGTVTGEISRVIKKIEQKIDDFRAACRAAGKYIPEAIGRRAGEMGEGMLLGLIDFAVDAAKILAISTAVGALVGSIFGGVGAVPGAEVGFEIGLMILEYYGLYLLIEAIVGVAGNLLSQLGRFVSLAWNAGGDSKQIEEAGKALADALGILVSAVMVVVAAYLLKRGAQALNGTRFARAVGESRLARWFEQRQKMTTTKKVVSAQAQAAEVAALARAEARRLLAAAAAEETAVTATLRAVATQTGGQLVGLANVLKTQKSLARKIRDQANAMVARGVPPERAVAEVSAGIKDALRYTMEGPTSQYMAMYQRTVRVLEAGGYVRNASKNTWAEPGSAQAGPYRGINESWRTPGGQVFEVQFHTQESFATKMETHPQYGEMRDAHTSPQRIAELNEQMTRMSDKIPVPEGAVPVDGTWPGGPARKGTH